MLLGVVDPPIFWKNTQDDTWISHCWKIWYGIFRWIHWKNRLCSVCPWWLEMVSVWLHWVEGLYECYRRVKLKVKYLSFIWPSNTYFVFLGLLVGGAATHRYDLSQVDLFVSASEGSPTKRSQGLTLILLITTPHGSRSKMVMLKDNHIASSGSIAEAVRRARTAGGFSIKVTDWLTDWLTDYNIEKMKYSCGDVMAFHVLLLTLWFPIYFAFTN